MEPLFFCFTGGRKTVKPDGDVCDSCTHSLHVNGRYEFTQTYRMKGSRADHGSQAPELAAFHTGHSDSETQVYDGLHAGHFDWSAYARSASWHRFADFFACKTIASLNFSKMKKTLLIVLCVLEQCSPQHAQWCMIQ